jgi:nucleotide-binding universal stress UspA family protein
MYEHVLIPTDGSDEAQKAIDHGVGLAAAFDATVHALYVVDLPNAPRTPHLFDDEEEVRERYEEYGRKVTGEVADTAAAAGIECVTAIRTGAPHEEIVDYAEDEGADLIVMGAGYRGRMRSLLGSTTEKVVRTSSVPVTTLRVEDDE